MRGYHLPAGDVRLQEGTAGGYIVKATAGRATMRTKLVGSLRGQLQKGALGAGQTSRSLDARP